MANAPAGQYYINGKDLYLIYGVYILKGSTNDFLKFPDKKDSIEHDWQDANGIDVDLSRVFLKSKEIDLKCLMFATSFDDFWDKYDHFFAELITPGLKRFEVSQFDRSFYIYYKSCSNVERYTKLKEVTKIVHSFTITIIQQDPSMSTNTYIVTENGRFLIT